MQKEKCVRRERSNTNTGVNAKNMRYIFQNYIEEKIKARITENMSIPWIISDSDTTLNLTEEEGGEGDDNDSEKKKEEEEEKEDEEEKKEKKKQMMNAMYTDK
jgi:hypothetical protein